MVTDWDALRYHRISTPQFDWGQRVIARLQPAPGESILDLGCGTGRLTQEILAAAPGAVVVGVDRSGAMIAVARESVDPAAKQRPMYVHADGTRLPFAGCFDAVFSAATLHWIQDQAAVFADVFSALAPGGRFVAQCGGRGNLERLLERTDGLISAPAFRSYYTDWTAPWYFADAESTAGRLGAAGFIDVDTSIEEAPVELPGSAAYAEFVSCVCIRHHLARLPAALQDRLVEALCTAASADIPPFALDYRRLNISARRAA